MKHRTRRSKLRRMRQRRYTLRRGGRNCSGMNRANYDTRKGEYVRIIADLARQYGKHPDHDYSIDVEILQNKHCESFLDDFAVFIDTHYRKYEKTRLGGLESFYNALVTRNFNK